MKVAFTTLGCKANQFDTAVMSQEVGSRDHQIVGYDETADVYVVNTCTVTENADTEARYWIRKAQERNPAARIIVTGCFAQTSPEKVLQIPGVNLVLGNGEKKNLPLFLSYPLGSDGAVSCVGEIEKSRLFDQPVLTRFLDKTRAFIKIQDGCNFNCSFCIIPKARGRSRSFNPADVVQQIREFETQGYREVVFTGINLGSYGLDLTPRQSLLSLFQELEGATRQIRFRFSSIEPNYFTDELLSALTGSSRVCRHFHIPLQSGDDQILRKMRRTYTVSDYRKLIEKFHRLSPESSIGADIMVGFPGESDDAFQRSCELVRDLPLTYLHVFPYSNRDGTVASAYSEQISPNTLRERSMILRQLGEMKANAHKGKQVGRSFEVIVEHFDSSDPNAPVTGLTDTYLKIRIENGRNLKANDRVWVRIDQCDGNVLVGNWI